MSKRYDAVIVGSGPAGTSAAYTLASGKASVLLVDRAVFPRKKLCGGLLTLKACRELDRTFGIGREEMERQEAVVHASAGFAIYLREALMARGEGKIPFLLSDRTVLDALLLARAQAAGAETVLGDAVTSCDLEAGIVRTASGRILEGRVVIGADGANSTVRRALPGLDRQAWQANLAAAVEIELSPEDVPGAPDYPVLYAGFIDCGYAWLFPNRGRYLAGICGLKRATPNIRAPFMDFLRHLGVPDPESRPLHGHPLPMGNYLKRPCGGRCLLAGDAAGIVDALFGEGIYYALASGRMAAESVLAAGFDPVAAAGGYCRTLETAIFPELAWSMRWRATLWFILNSIHHLPVSFLIGRNTGILLDMVHGLRSWRWLARNGPAAI